MRIFLAFFSALVLALPLAGCDGDDFLLNGFKTLSVAGDTYDGVMKACGRAHADGLLDDDGRERVERAAEVYRGAYLVGVEALGTYYSLKSTASREAADVAVREVSRRLTEVIALAVELGVTVKQPAPGKGS